MKNLVLPILLTSFLFLACENKEASNDDRNSLIYAKTTLGGCNAPMETVVARSIQLSEPDTAIITISDDTVSFYIGITYLCCTPFTSQTELENNAITLTITDSCDLNGFCYCRCDCYYTWDFQFTYSEAKNYTYKIILERPYDEFKKIVQEGMVILED